MDLFVNNEDDENTSKKKKAEKSPDVKFPKVSDTPVMPSSSHSMPTMETPVQPVNVTVGATNCAPYMDKVMEVYEKGFDDLNQPGIEFFEFFKAVHENGLDNPMAYTMAFKMLSGMDPSMTKESLIKESQFYINEIDKVHQKFEQDGQRKQAQLQEQRKVETEGLQGDIVLLQQKVQNIMNEIESKKESLAQMDSKYNPQIEEIGCKLEANDHARNQIKGSLQKCVNGITVNL